MKTPKARKLASGSWFIQLRLGGQSIPITAYTERECIKQAEMLKAEYRGGKLVERNGVITLSRAIDKYIESREAVLSPSTIRGYRIIQRNRFQGVMQRPISSINNWQSIINAEAKLCNAKTLKNSFLFIRSVLKSCGVETPANVQLPQVIRADHAFLQPEQIPVFLNAINGDPCEVGALLALHSLRRSEIIAISADNIHDGNIYVRGSVVPDENNRFVAKTTNKNSTSARVVPIMIPRLQELADGGYIQQLHPDTLRKRINAICADNGLPEVGVHGLRHSFASLAYHLGLTEEQTMRLGGWADAATMRKIYTHLAEEDQKESVVKMSAFFNATDKEC